jgi:hypothetical protein
MLLRASLVKRCSKDGVPSTSSFSPLMPRQLRACWISEVVATLAKALVTPTWGILAPRGHLQRLQTLLAENGPAGLTRGYWKWRSPDKQAFLYFFPLWHLNSCHSPAIGDGGGLVPPVDEQPGTSGTEPQLIGSSFARTKAMMLR